MNDVGELRATAAGPADMQSAAETAAPHGSPSQIPGHGPEAVSEAVAQVNFAHEDAMSSRPAATCSSSLAADTTAPGTPEQPSLQTAGTGSEVKREYTKGAQIDACPPRGCLEALSLVPHWSRLGSYSRWSHAAGRDPPIINTEAPETARVGEKADWPETNAKVFRKQVASFEIPSQLVKPGIEMLKVSAKSARRVKPRMLWLEIGGETPDDGELGLELGVGIVGGQDVRLCWEKGGAGIGERKSFNAMQNSLLTP